MANNIYLTTHDGLTALVSARAASKALSVALRNQGSSPDTVSFEQMKVILLGPVRQEFVSILPPAGLERSLKQLLARLKELPPPEPEKLPVGLPKNVPAEPRHKSAIPTGDTVDERDAKIFQTLAFVESPGPGDPASAPLEAVRVESASPAAVLIRELVEEEAAEEAAEGAKDADTTTSEVEEVAAEVEPVEADGADLGSTDIDSANPDPKAADPETAGSETVGLEADSETIPETEPPVEEMPAAPPEPAPVQPTRKISEAALNDAVMTFAQLDHVRLIAAFNQAGKSVVSRGDGFDLAALSRLSGMALKLLGKSGALRSYYLAHSEGQLFLFPHGGYTLMVIGNAELNLGLVFTTLQKLKEEM